MDTYYISFSSLMWFGLMHIKCISMRTSYNALNYTYVGWFLLDNIMCVYTVNVYMPHGGNILICLPTPAGFTFAFFSPVLRDDIANNIIQTYSLRQIFRYSAYVHSIHTCMCTCVYVYGWSSNDLVSCYHILFLEQALILPSIR